MNEDWVAIAVWFDTIKPLLTHEYTPERVLRTRSAMHHTGLATVLDLFTTKGVLEMKLIDGEFCFRLAK
jgi:hypothetical protein